jgi:fatty acid desaturase
VRAAVSPKDDPSLPVNTVRQWVIGIVFTIVSAAELSDLLLEGHNCLHMSYFDDRIPWMFYS